jgi:hypothetical protein
MALNSEHDRMIAEFLYEGLLLLARPPEGLEIEGRGLCLRFWLEREEKLLLFLSIADIRC